jgi:ArsR family transcriptional regulator
MKKEFCQFIDMDGRSVVRLKKALPNLKVSQKMAETFKILSDPTRLKIVSALERDELCVCDLAVLIGLNQSLVSHHLQVLRQVNVVTYHRSGKMTYYSLSDDHISSLLAIARDHVDELI